MAYTNIFVPGPRLIDGTVLNKALAFPNLDYKSGLIATVGGAQATSILIQNALSEFDTVASTGACSLPYAIPGTQLTIVNAGANNLTVFALAAPVGQTASAIINAAGVSTAGATGITLPNGRNADFYCTKTGLWVMALAAAS